MKIHSIKITDILSIQDNLISFDETGLVLVQGWNHDIGRSNGAGKTAIFNALSFALYDKMPRKITASEILRRGAKHGSVEVVCSNGDVRYKVVRSRPKGVSFYVVTEEKEEKIEVNQSEWENKLGLTYQQFIITMYCAQNSPSRFLSLSDTEKKSFLLQLLNLEEFSTCKVLIDKKIKDIEEILRRLDSTAGNINSKIEVYKESIIDEEIVRANIRELIGKIQNVQQEIEQLSLVPPPSFEQYQKIEDNVAVKKQYFNTLKAQRSFLYSRWQSLQRSIVPFSGESKCSKCGTELDQTQAIEHHELEMTKIKEELATILQQINCCDEALLEESKIDELHCKLKQKKIEDSIEHDKAIKRINELNHLIYTLQREQKNLEEKIAANVELTKKVNNLNKLFDQTINETNQNKTALELNKTISNICSPMGAPAYVLDATIEEFNAKISEFINILWPNMTYVLQSYKETSKGDISTRFSESITIDGVPISLGSLSGGEFRALSLCVDFALTEILERRSGIFLSPIILDEPFDGLDTHGRELLLELLANVSQDRQIVVIDHSSELKSMFCKTINVEKRNGVSVVNS